VINNVLTIGEFARQSGLSAHTIRFYESVGVLRPSHRATNGHRRYHDADVQWLQFVLKLKLIGMPLAEIKQYADLRAKGDATLEPRMTMLKLHHQRLVTSIAELEDCARVLDDKIRTYRKLIVSTERRNAKINTKTKVKR
jgi:DNA-binding transcriptional MerR regulator